jgi:hypothetical protein
MQPITASAGDQCAGSPRHAISSFPRPKPFSFRRKGRTSVEKAERDVFQLTRVGRRVIAARGILTFGTDTPSRLMAAGRQWVDFTAAFEIARASAVSATLRPSRSRNRIAEGSRSESFERPACSHSSFSSRSNLARGEGARSLGSIPGSSSSEIVGRSTRKNIRISFRTIVHSQLLNLERRHNWCRRANAWRRAS